MVVIGTAYASEFTTTNKGLSAVQPATVLRLSSQPCCAPSDFGR